LRTFSSILARAPAARAPRAPAARAPAAPPSSRGLLRRGLLRLPHPREASCGEGSCGSPILAKEIPGASVDILAREIPGGFLHCSSVATGVSPSLAHPKASAFRVNGFRWEEEGKALFEGVSATGSIGWGPASNCAKPISSSSTTHEVEDEHVDHEESSSMGTMGTSNDVNPVEAEFMSVEPSKKKKKQVHDIDIKFEKLIDIFMHDVENVRQGGPSVICAPSLIDCCKKLDEMALSRTDVLYAQAVVLFSDEKMREQWMQWCGLVEDSTSKMNWLMGMLKMKNII
ncbi:hypothetical protein Taro_003390, partial [Colocasia esculenta]|nr:hypothetical protein [Colocasia esculenta]